MTNYDKIFNLCVILLDWMALKFDTTYIKINVWIFCIIWPLYTILITFGFLHLYFRFYEFMDIIK
jgi:hypothetical protein